MANQNGFFEFSTNIDKIQAEITAGLDRIVRSSQQAASGLAGGSSASTSGFLNNFRTELESLGRQGIQQIEALGVQFRDAFAKSFGPGGTGAAGFKLPNGSTFAAQSNEVMQATLRQASELATRSISTLPPGAASSGAAAAMDAAVKELGTGLSRIMSSMTTDLRGMAPFKSGTGVRDSTAVGENIGPDVMQAFEHFAQQVRNAVLAATPEVIREAEAFAHALSQMSQRATMSVEQREALVLGSAGKGPLGGLVSREGPDAFRFNSPSGQEFNVLNGRLTDHDSVDQARGEADAARQRTVGTGDNQTTLSAETVYARALLDQAEAAQSSASAVVSEERRQAEAAQKLIAAEENEARAHQAVADQASRSIRPGSPIRFSPDAGGFVNTKSGELLTHTGDITASYEQLAQSLSREVAAAEKAAQTPLGALGQGFFGAGGRKRTGGAGEVAPENPLNGFFETAGIVAKYELQGVAIYKLGEVASEAFKHMAQLDQGVAQLNSTLGIGKQVSNAFVGELQNMALVAGETAVQALHAAQAGIAAFSNFDDKTSDRETVGKAFVKSAVQLGQVAGVPLENSAHSAIAIGSSYELTADQLGQVSNAIAVSRETFGSNSAQVLEGVRELADAGHAAGYSLEELTQVVARVQAVTDEGGGQIAGSLGRIFSLFQSKQAAGFLQTLNVDTSGNTKEQIENVAEAFTRTGPGQLSEKQKNQLEAQLGGTRSLKELIPLLKDQPLLQEAYARALDDTTAAQRQQDAVINSVAGQMRIFGQTLRNVALDVARSGIFTPIIIAVKALEPLLQVLDHFLQLWDALPGVMKGGLSVLLEIAAVSKILTTSFGLQAKAAVGGVFASMAPGSRAARQEVAGLRVAGTAAISEAGLAYSTGAITQEAALARTAAGLRMLEEATVAEAAAKGVNTGATTANSAAHAAGTAEEVVETATRGQSALASKLASAEESLAKRREAVTTTGLVGVLERFSIAIAEATATTGRLAATGAAGLFGGLRGVSTANAGTSAGSIVGSLPVVATAAAVAFTDFEFYKHLKGLNKTLEAGYEKQGTEVGLTDPEEMKTAAADLSTASGDIKHASSGFFGSITGALSEFSGGVDRGQLAESLKKEAEALSAGAENIGKAREVLNAKFNAGGIDYQALDGVATGLKNMVSHGASAADQLNAMSTALEAFAATAAGSTTIMAGQGGLIGAQIASSSQQSFAEGLNTLYDLTDDNAVDWKKKGLYGQMAEANGETVYDVHKAVKDLRHNVDEKKLEDDLNEGLTGYFENQYPNGGVLDGPAKIAAVEESKKVLIESLKKQGIEFAKLPKSVQDYLSNEGVAYGAYEILNTINAANGKNPAVTKDNINEILKAAPALAKQAGQNAATSNSLFYYEKPAPEDADDGGIIGRAKAEHNAAVPHRQFSTVVQAQTALSYLEKLRADNIAAGADATQVHQYDLEIESAKVDVANAVLQQAQALAQLAASAASPFDKAGQIAGQLKSIDALLGSGKVTDPAQITALQTQRNQLHNQAIQQSINDSVSAIGTGTDSRDTVKSAKDKLDQANAKLNAIRANGGKGQDVNDAIRAANDAQTNYNKSLVDASSAEAAAGARPGDPQSAARANLNSARIRLNGDIKGTAQYWNDYKAVQDAKYALAQSNADASRGAIEASVIPGDKLSEARAALAEARIDLAKDKNNAAAYGADLRKLHEAQYQLAETEREIAENNRLLHIDLTDPVAVANEDVAEARRKLARDRARGADTSADQVDLRKKTESAAQASFDQRMNDEKTMLDLHEITGAQYINFLRGQDASLRAQLATKKKGSEGYRRLLDELNAVDKAILDYNNQAAGQFNIGDIRVPSPYEARREVAVRNAGVSYQGDYTTNVTITINGDPQLFEKVLQKHLGPAQTQRNSTTPRKV